MLISKDVSRLMAHRYSIEKAGAELHIEPLTDISTGILSRTT